MTIMVDGAAVKPEVAATREELAAITACPECGSEVIDGFGLGFGGYGPYKLCARRGCGFVRKHDLGPEAE